MPDASVRDALAEAYALAPSDDIVLHTLEVRHPPFVDDGGSPDSMWSVADDEDIQARIEVGATVSAGAAGGTALDARSGPLKVDNVGGRMYGGGGGGGGGGNSNTPSLGGGGGGGGQGWNNPAGGAHLHAGL